MSLFLDVAILLRTFKTILVGLRHSEDDEDPQDQPDVVSRSRLKVLSGGPSQSSADSKTA